MVKKLLLFGVVLLLLAGMGAGVLWQWWHTSAPGQPGQVITIAEGSSLSAVARDLERAELLRWPRAWTTIARLQGRDARIHRGEYRFDSDITPGQLLDALVEGKVISYSVTLPEGITLAEAIGILQSQAALKSVLDGTADARLMAMVSPHMALEGLFFPDTYQFVRGDTDLDILRTAHRRLQSELDEAWNSRDVGLPYQSPYDALIMASIVEKETGVPAERGEIAGVFVRRLEKRMRLQTDPTVIYGLGEGFDGNLRRRHLDDEGNPYNTYRHHGLPPTPIALAGRAALQAAVHPEAGSALYFVAKGDGSHVFSETLEQHTAAVRQYQLKRRKDYRSSPPPEESQP